MGSSGRGTTVPEIREYNVVSGFVLVGVAAAAFATDNAAAYTFTVLLLVVLIVGVATVVV